MVGHVNRGEHNFGDAVSTEVEAALPALTAPLIPTLTDEAPSAPHALGAALGEIHGVATIKDEFGNVKGTFTFGGPTGLTREELEQELGVSIPLVTGGEEQNGGNPDHDGA